MLTALLKTLMQALFRLQAAHRLHRLRYYQRLLFLVGFVPPEGEPFFAFAPSCQSLSRAAAG